MQQFVNVMKALSDPNRVKIVKMLQNRSEMCVCELRAALALAQPTVSKHLQVLEGAGLVSRTKNGQWVNYSLSGGDTPYAKAMLDLVGSWLNSDEEIVSLLDELPKLDRRDICAVKPAE